MATVAPAEGSHPIVAHHARFGAAPETARWLRRWVAVAVILLTVVTVLTAFADDMPASHRLAVPPAAALILAGWMVELSGVRWPRFGLIAANVLPNLWLAFIQHGIANYLFLLLLVPWVALVGSRAEGAVAFALSLATVVVAAGLVADGQQLPWSAWISLSAILLLVWLMALVLRRQEQLVGELRRARADAERRTHEAAVLEERQRLARELHDSVTQALYGVSLYAEAAGRALADGDSSGAAANVREIGETTQEALREMRLLIFGLRPPLLEEYGLAGALQSRLGAVEARAGLVAEFSGDGAERLPPGTEQELYRLAQEALNNVLKHAHASRVAVRLDVSTDRAALEIADDGIGFEPSLRGGDGLGLPGMRERAERIGGTLQVESAPGSGTRVRVAVPR